jgi:hypothetical protein
MKLRVNIPAVSGILNYMDLYGVYFLDSSAFKRGDKETENAGTVFYCGSEQKTGVTRAFMFHFGKRNAYHV